MCHLQRKFDEYGFFLKMVDFLLQNVPKRPRKSGPVYKIKSCKSKSGLNFSIRPKPDNLRSISARHNMPIKGSPVWKGDSITSTVRIFYLAPPL